MVQLTFNKSDPKYSCKHFGIFTELLPSKLFSINAIKHRPTASPEPLIV